MCEVHDFVHFPVLERGAKELELENIDIEKGKRNNPSEFLNLWMPKMETPCMFHLPRLNSKYH
jgi:hypothetical protein